MKRRAVRIMPVLLLLVLVDGCARKVVTPPGQTPQPVLDNIAVQLAQITDGARATRQIKEVLFAEGKISREASNRLTRNLIRLDTTVKVMNEKLGTYDSFTPTAKEDLKKLFADVKDGRRTLIDAGVIPASANVDKALVIIDAAIAALEVFLR